MEFLQHCKPNIIFRVDSIVERYQCDIRRFVAAAPEPASNPRLDFDFTEMFVNVQTLDEMRTNLLQIKNKYLSISHGSNRQKRITKRLTQKKRTSMQIKNAVPLQHKSQYTTNQLKVTRRRNPPLLTSTDPHPHSRLLHNYMDGTERPYMDILKKSNQYKLWIYRHTLFFGILLFIHRLLEEEKKKKEVETFQIPTNIKNILRQLQSLAKPEIELSILGSIQPHSDIDVGITYYTSPLNNPNHLSNFIYLIENTFLWILEKPSLFYDIEFYADFMTYKDAEGNKQIINTSILNDENSFRQLLPHAISSYLRNYYYLMKDAKYTIKLTRRQFLEKITPPAKFANTNDKTSHLEQYITEDVFREAKQMTMKYIIDTNYNSVIRIHKQKVRQTSIAMKEYMQDITNPAKLLQLLQSSARVNLFREESYVCIPTILHVVKIMQLDEMTRRAKTTIRDCITNPTLPVCYITAYGYYISIIEQMGYIARFHKNPKKVEKYKKRLENAFVHISEL